MITAMVIFGTLGPFVRNIPVSSGELALYRGILAAVLLGLVLLITGQKIPVAQLKKELVLLLLSGGALGVNWMLLFEAYKHTTVSVATLSYYFAPVLVAAVCPVLFREKMTPKQILCLIMSTIGLVLVTGIGSLTGQKQHWIGIAFGLGAAVFYATVVILNKYIKGVEGLHRTFVQFLSAAAVLIPYVVLTEGISLARVNGFGWLNLLIVGILHTGITYCLYFSALKELPGQKAAILSYIDPLTAVIISVTLLGEPLKTQQILGGILILGFTLWNELTPYTPKAK